MSTVPEQPSGSMAKEIEVAAHEEEYVKWFSETANVVNRRNDDMLHRSEMQPGPIRSAIKITIRAA